MDTNALRSWLGLPPGPWPPDDRTLLGLPPGPVDPALAERRALALMGKLRTHQLVNPDLVTEGMNRLAQAMLAVTSSASGSVPDLLVDEFPAIEVQQPEEPEAGPLVEVLEAVAVQEAPQAQPEPAAPKKPRRATQPASVRPSAPALPAARELPPRDIGPGERERRRAYRELAGLRGLLAAWDRLRAFADPTNSVANAAEVFDFLDATESLRVAAVHPGLEPGAAHALAPRVVAVARQPLALAVFRSLTPAQRQALARDWATARALLAGQVRQLRDGLRASRPTVPSRSGEGFESLLARNPEWVLGFATLFVFLVATVRLVLRS